MGCALLGIRSGVGLYDTPTPANGIDARPELNIYYWWGESEGWDPSPAQERESIARLLWGDVCVGGTRPIRHV